MNKIEYDNAKAELAVLEQDYSDMGRIMELRNKVAAHDEEKDKSSATHQQKDPEQAAKRVVARAATPPAVVYHENEVDLENGENWFEQDSIENYDNQINSWEKIQNPYAQKVAATLKEERDRYKVQLDDQRKKIEVATRGETLFKKEGKWTEEERGEVDNILMALGDDPSYEKVRNNLKKRVSTNFWSSMGDYAKQGLDYLGRLIPDTLIEYNRGKGIENAYSYANLKAEENGVYEPGAFDRAMERTNNTYEDQQRDSLLAHLDLAESKQYIDFLNDNLPGWQQFTAETTGVATEFIPTIAMSAYNPYLGSAMGLWQLQNNVYRDVLVETGDYDQAINTSWGEMLKAGAAEAATAGLLKGGGKLIPKAASIFKGKNQSAEVLVNPENLNYTGTKVNSRNPNPSKYPSITTATNSEIPESVIYRRVQGGIGNNTSKERISINANGTLNINAHNKNLSISAQDKNHSEYFLNKRGNQSYIVEFEIPQWFDDMVKSNAIPQKNYLSNPKNQNQMAPKIVDPLKPGLAYEFPAPWTSWLEEYAFNGKIIK